MVFYCIGDDDLKSKAVVQSLTGAWKFSDYAPIACNGLG